MLRDYQKELINKVREAFKNGYKRPLVVLGCGGGKTVCFSYMAHEHVKLGGKVAFLVHRKELLDQAKKIVGDDPNIYIGMISQNLKIEPTLIIFDEGHHANAKTWRKIIDKYPNAYIIGLTATPCRQDGSSLGAVYDCIVEGVSTEWMIENNYLSHYKYYAPKNLFNCNSESEVSEIPFKNAIYGDVIKYIDYNKKTIIYCPNIAFSKALAELIKGAVHFDGDTPKTERENIIKDFKNGAIRVLLNVDLISEGFDVPDCDCVILLRPTMSLSLYIQQACRCLRYREGKEAIIYDLVGNVFRHGMPTQKHEWTLKGKIKTYNPSAEPDIIVRQCKKCFRVYEGIKQECPYCHFINVKTKKQIEIEKQHELEEIKATEVKERKSCWTYEQLVELGKKRGYKNYKQWAWYVYNGRKNRI